MELLCAGSDQGKNVACVLGCAEVRGLQARQIKSGWFPADDVDCSTTAWSIVSVSLNLHDINKSSGRTAHRPRGASRDNM